MAAISIADVFTLEVENVAEFHFLDALEFLVGN